MLGRQPARRQSIVNPKYAPPDLDQQPTPVDPWRELAQPQRPKDFEREAAPHEGRIPNEQLRKSVINPFLTYIIHDNESLSFSSQPSRPNSRPPRSFRSYPPSDRVSWTNRFTSQTPPPRELPKISTSLLSKSTTRTHRDDASPSTSTPPRNRPSDKKLSSALEEDFDQGNSTVPITDLPEKFSSPPLLFGLLQSVYEVLGPNAVPSPIQALSLKHLFAHPPHIPSKNKPAQDVITSPVKYPWNQYLLASETGSGKSIAYLLPMLHYLKSTEHNPAPLPSDSLLPEGPVLLRPRGLILAPTHELSRQLSNFTKSLSHNIKLRVQCASQANTASSSHGTNSTASQLKRALEANKIDIEKTTVSSAAEENGGELVIERRTHPVDILVGTPTRLLEMVRGIGWDLKDQIQDDWDEARKQRARDWVPGPPKLSLRNVEWVVVDEADVLFRKHNVL